MRTVLLCNPENRRAQFFARACTRLGLPSPTLVAYTDWLAGRVDLTDVLDAHTLLRIESPGESLATQRLLLARGASHEEATCSTEQALTWTPEHGQIIHGAQRFYGWCDALRTLQHILTQTGSRAMSSPEDIAAMFDKSNTFKRLSSHKIDAPERLPAATSYAHLREILHMARCRRAFLKPRFGSSASGVVALEVRGSRIRATTSAQLEYGKHKQVKLFNSLRIQRYEREEEIRALVDTLTTEPVVVERWVPKASIARQSVDLRIVVIGGQATHVLGRRSASPMTNLHLGNTRVLWPELEQAFGAQALEQAKSLAARAMREAFCDSLYAGLDVLLTSGSLEARIIEVNAFGDLLPNLLVDGEDTYTCALRHATRSFSTGSS